ncbi:hypothetical protein PENTCL1PPCAC_21398 [Pristionchus entomophagus]|uniref:Uncharacterized protein n=1 Tax=Pristionchus entomophagus TaxID=358040 RepID=A0AAV5TXF5_9BILA|nr:hypothetical protein PENTCL1PPCAC_21398 [Pristionchus entomophagus]
MRFLTVFLIVSCFAASEAYFGEGAVQGTGDFFTSLMDKLKGLTGGNEVAPPAGGNSSLPDPGPISENYPMFQEPRPTSPAPVEKK